MCFRIYTLTLFYKYNSSFGTNSDQGILMALWLKSLTSPIMSDVSLNFSHIMFTFGLISLGKVLNLLNPSSYELNSMISVLLQGWF